MKIALQLYSIRDDMEKNMDEALGKVKAIGYDYVEFAGYFGKSAEEVKALLDKHGLECVSVHQNPVLFKEQGQEAVDFLKTIGAKHCAIPHWDVNTLKGTDGWDGTVELFTNSGKLLKENGIQQLYHNHDFEFNKYDDKLLLDWLFETIPQEYLQPQIDTCWVHYAGYNPSEYLTKYAGRIDVVHLKDFSCTKLGSGPVYALIGKDGTEEKKADKGNDGFEFRPLGKGIQDFPSIIDAAIKAGAQIAVVEQDMSVGMEPMESAKISREYLKNLGY